MRAYARPQNSEDGTCKRGRGALFRVHGSTNKEGIDSVKMALHANSYGRLLLLKKYLQVVDVA